MLVYKMTKICSKCKIEKTLDNFQKRYDRPVGVRPHCRECQKEIDTKNRQTDKGKKKYRKQLWKQAGINISYEEYLDRYNLLQGKCEICNLYFTTLCVDHCHTTGKIRGLLCTKCNLGLENFKESKDVMNSAIKYIENSGVSDE